MITDRDLTKIVAEAKLGSHSAFEELILISEKMVFNIALRMLKNESDALDISQEEYIKDFKSIGSFD